MLRELGEDDFIVSKTDTKGRITYVNRIFMELAEYKEEDGNDAIVNLYNILEEDGWLDKYVDKLRIFVGSILDKNPGDRKRRIAELKVTDYDLMSYIMGNIFSTRLVLMTVKGNTQSARNINNIKDRIEFASNSGMNISTMVPLSNEDKTITVFDMTTISSRITLSEVEKLLNTIKQNKQHINIILTDVINNNVV